MSGSEVAIAKLRRLADPAEPLTATDRTWIAEAVGRYLAGAEQGVTLDQALGVATSRGGEPWWRREQRRQRDELIRELARRLVGRGRASKAAMVVGAMLNEYRRRDWPADRLLDRCPSAYIGTPREIIFAIHKVDEQPPRERALAQIIDRVTGTEIVDFTAYGEVEND